MACSEVDLCLEGNLGLLRAIEQLPLCSVRGFAAWGSRLPTQNWFASGADFVETANARGVRRGLHNFRLRRGFLRDGFHGIDKEVTFFLGLRFRRLAHHPSRRTQRKR